MKSVPAKLIAAKPRILIADDEPSMREMTRQLFHRAGFDVLLAADGVAALELLQREFVDVVLTDIGMPQMDGIKLTETLRREMPDVKVVILTIYNDDERVFSAIKAGARGYVLKDSQPEEIVQAMLWICSPQNSFMTGHSLVLDGGLTAL